MKNKKHALTQNTTKQSHPPLKKHTIRENNIKRETREAKKNLEHKRTQNHAFSGHLQSAR